MAPPAGTSPENPKIVYNGKTLWLPRKFGEWKAPEGHKPSITEGDVYVQVVSHGSRYKISAKTLNFPDTSEVWVEGEAAQLFSTAWAAFYAWAKVGNVFSLYRSAADSTAGTSYFQYCVWNLDNKGFNLQLGRPRWQVEIGCLTESASR
jgi:hypothetical protein